MELFDAAPPATLVLTDVLTDEDAELEAVFVGVIVLVELSDTEMVLVPVVVADCDIVLDTVREIVVVAELVCVVDPDTLKVEDAVVDTEVDADFDSVLVAELDIVPVWVVVAVVEGRVVTVLDAVLDGDMECVDDPVDDSVVDPLTLAVDEPESERVLDPVLDAELEAVDDCVVEALLLIVELGVCKGVDVPVVEAESD